MTMQPRPGSGTRRRRLNAVTAAYAPADPRPLPPPNPSLTIAELADRAVAIGDPHAIKYADVLAAAPDPALLTAALRSVDELTN